MFSWSKKNESKKKRRSGGGGGPALNEFGIPVNAGGGGNDEELEAELRALTGGVITTEEDLELNDEGSDVEAEFLKLVGGGGKGKKKKSKKSPKHKKNKDDDYSEGSLAVNTGDLTDVNEDVLEDEDLDVDENDPDLLEELMDITGMDDEVEEQESEEGEEEEEEEEESKKQEVTVLSLLTERLKMYKTAEANAKQNKESSRARRFGRGIKTLQQLIKKAEAGQPVLPSEIPPEIATNLKPAPPPPPPPAPPEEEEEPKVEEVPDDAPTEDMSRLKIDPRPEEPEEDKRPARESPPPREEPPQVDDEIRQPPPKEESPLMKLLQERRDEYKTYALKAKRNSDLETALKHVKVVKQLNELIAMVEFGEVISEVDIPPSLMRPPEPKPVETVTPLKFEAPAEVEEEYEFPTTVLEALNQRLRIYKGLCARSEQEGDDLGMRKNAKIVQVYTEAIKLHTAGKKVPLQKLPTPPGCPPIPIPFEIDDE